LLFEKWVEVFIYDTHRFYFFFSFSFLLPGYRTNSSVLTIHFTFPSIYHHPIDLHLPIFYRITPSPTILSSDFALDWALALYKQGRSSRVLLFDYYFPDFFCVDLSKFAFL